MTEARIHVDGGATGLLFGIDDEGRLRQLALGGSGLAQWDQAFPTWLYPLALPTFGEEALRQPALVARHGDGAGSTRLVVEDHAATAHPHGVDHRIVLRDRVAPLEVVMCARTWPDHGVIEQWLEITNQGATPMVIAKAASAAPARPAAGAWWTHWGGGWANEWDERSEPLTPGVKVVAGAGGVRSSLYLPPVVLWSADGRAREEDGEVLLASLEWGGDACFEAEIAMHGQARLLVGYQHRGAERHLDPGERFVTPPAVLAWSGSGVGPITRRLHRWVRAHRVRDGERSRAIACNNWEAMGFAMDTASVQEVVDGAAALGAELFLLDDGWFGTDHPRNDDTAGLGDWDVDRAKFPDGLGPVIDHTLAAGLRFGLWVEPEMVNPRSRCYEAHPDWVVAEPGRERREERQQLVLDLLQPEVRDAVTAVVDDALALHPGISYLKWDANRDLFEAGSPALPADRQSHLAVDRVRATEALMADVARRHPDVELMLCASGGGRSNLGDLRWFHELWTSDNTDPVDRVRIQWGASHLLPALVLGAHVTRWGDKPVPFGCAVAMSARFGFDIDPRSMTDEERGVAAAAAADYRRIRPLVQHGDLHRLVSPVGSPVGALAFLDPGAAGSADPGTPCAVVFAFRLADGDAGAVAADTLPPIALGGLVAGRRYRIEDITPGSAHRGDVVERDGADLASDALAWPEAPAPSAAVVLISPAG